MAKFDKESLLTLLEILADDNVSEEDVKAEKAKREAEEKAKREAEDKAKREEEERLAEEAKRKNEDGNKQSEEDDELAKLKLKDLQRDLKSGLKDKGLDDEYFDSLSEFVSYDKMKDDEGNADPEKVEKLVGILTSIALREPPKGGGVEYDPSNQGLGKYLK